MLANLLAWLGRSKAGQWLFAFFVERLFALAKQLVAEWQKRQENKALKDKIFNDLQKAVTAEEKQNAVEAIAKYLVDK